MTKLEELEKLKAQRDALDKQIKALENGRWKPEVGELYYSPYFGSAITWENGSEDKRLYEIDQVFRTTEERDAYVNRLKAVTKYNDYIRSTGFVADCGDGEQLKYYASYNAYKKEWVYKPAIDFVMVTDILPAADGDDVLAAIASLGDDERWLR